jgi:hypothetical protein
MHGALLELRPLAPGSDLKRAFVAAMLEHIDGGWQPGGTCFKAFTKL